MRARHSAATMFLVALSWASASAAQPSHPVWEIRSSEAMDLWYYGLAAIRFAGPGTIPYYSADFARRVREDRRARGLAVSRLDAEAASLGEALKGDTVFEALHFLPLYFHGDGAQLIASVRSIVTGGSVSHSDVDRDDASRGAIAGVIATPTQRAALGRFVNALEEERPSFLLMRKRDEGSAERLSALTARWEGEFAPALAPYLGAIAVRSGAIIVSPGLGAEGRIIRDGSAVTIAVGSGPADLPLFAVVRELCFPMVELVAAPAMTSRLAAIDLANRAAVRCGAMLLDSANAQLADEYRRSYLGRSITGPRLHREFDAQFPLAPALEQSLRGNVDRATSGARKIGR